jgi:hypothetical protein
MPSRPVPPETYCPVIAWNCLMWVWSGVRPLPRRSVGVFSGMTKSLAGFCSLTFEGRLRRDLHAVVRVRLEVREGVADLELGHIEEVQRRLLVALELQPAVPGADVLRRAC